MLQQEPIQSSEEAKAMIEAAYRAGGIPQVIDLLSDYAGEAIIASSPEEVETVRTNALHISYAMLSIDIDAKLEISRLWSQISASAIGVSKTAEMLEKIVGRLIGQVSNSFQSELDRIIAQFEADGVGAYESIPLSHFCESFQAWSVDTEEILRGTSSAEADVTVYKVMEHDNNAICVVLAEIHTEPQAGKKRRMTILVPFSCIEDEEHFSGHHYDEMQEKLGEFLTLI